MRGHYGEIEPSSATLAQDGLPEYGHSGKDPLKHSAKDGNWTRTTEDREWDSFILSLSYPDQGRRKDRQWDSFILSLSYHDPDHGEDRLGDTFVLPLSYHDPGHGEDSEIHSFSHWDIMTDPIKYLWLMTVSWVKLVWLWVVTEKQLSSDKNVDRLGSRGLGWKVKVAHSH